MPLIVGREAEAGNPSEDWRGAVGGSSRENRRGGHSAVCGSGGTAPPKPPLFEGVSDDDLLVYGVPEEWLGDVRQVRDEDGLFELGDHLPQEAAEALLELATGGTPEPQPVTGETDPFEHPDAKRRFRVMSNVEELEQALKFPWEKWSVFLHPVQKATVERNFNGPARVSGSAGTGKTIVALHRAVHLARVHRDARVLLTTFSETWQMLSEGGFGVSSDMNPASPNDWRCVRSELLVAGSTRARSGDPRLLVRGRSGPCCWMRLHASKG